MKRLLPVVALVMLLAVAAWGEDKRPNQVSKFMQQKLPRAQDVLEGLVLEDYEKIAVNAQKLSLLSLESTWQVIETEEYALQSAEFRRAALAMAKAAEEKNLDAVALAYVETTMKCVKCHNYVRDAASQAAPAKVK